MPPVDDEGEIALLQRSAMKCTVHPYGLENLELTISTAKGCSGGKSCWLRVLCEGLEHCGVT